MNGICAGQRHVLGSAGLGWDERFGAQAQLTTATIDVEGQPLSGPLLDLTPWGLGWIATLRPDRRYRLDIAATGMEPTSVTLVRYAVDELEHPKPR